MTGFVHMMKKTLSDSFYEVASPEEISEILNKRIKDIFNEMSAADNEKKLDLFYDIIKYMKLNGGHFFYDENVYSIFSSYPYLKQVYDSNSKYKS